MTFANPENKILPPPTERYTILGWVYKNLFRTWYDTLLTIGSVLILYFIFAPLLSWAFTTAKWEVINANLRLLMIGQYPPSELWRIWACVYLAAILIGLSWGMWVRERLIAGIALLAMPFVFMLFPSLNLNDRLNLGGTATAALAAFFVGRTRGKSLTNLTVVSWVIYFPLIIFLVRGLNEEKQFFGVVSTNFWGGLLLTFLLTVVGIVFSFPFGVLLALGRRSSLTLVKLFCITFIEVIRGVPFVTIIFMSQLVLPLFLPAGMNLDRVIRVMAGIVIFSAAYLAENVRGGLQAIPKGQFEAANALGLNGLQTMIEIILPQALRAIIPILVGQFIGLFKDTSLVAIVSLYDLLGISRSLLAQPDFIGRQPEVYMFISAIYWIFSYVMSYVSQRLEVRLGVGER
jgi:general L-amino acid transport system permease protein